MYEPVLSARNPSSPNSNRIPAAVRRPERISKTRPGTSLTKITQPSKAASPPATTTLSGPAIATIGSAPTRGSWGHRRSPKEA